MKTVVVGSNNPVKVATTKEAFAAVFPEETFTFHTHAAASGVPDQPFGSAETKRGATNRAKDSHQAVPEADFCVGLEGGLEKDLDQYWAFAWMCVLSEAGTMGCGKTSSFMLPPEVGTLIAAGQELGQATDVVFNEVNSKHKGGAVGALTNGLITRKDFYRDAMIFALIPFVQPELYLKTPAPLGRERMVPTRVVGT